HHESILQVLLKDVQRHGRPEWGWWPERREPVVDQCHGALALVKLRDLIVGGFSSVRERAVHPVQPAPMSLALLDQCRLGGGCGLRLADIRGPEAHGIEERPA